MQGYLDLANRLNIIMNQKGKGMALDELKRTNSHPKHILHLQEHYFLQRI